MQNLMSERKKEESFEATFFGEFGLHKGEAYLDQPYRRSRQATKLLGLLILHVRDPWPAARLTELLWPGTSEAPRHALSNLTYRLRKMLAEVWPGEELILSRNGSVQWNPAVPIVTDVERFDRADASLSGSELTPEAVTVLEQTVKQYTGKFLEEYSDDVDLLLTQTYYQNLYMKFVDLLVQSYEASHEYEKMYNLCKDALQIDPLEEMAHCGVIKAFIGANRFSDAEAYYHDTVKMLQDQLGSVPFDDLRKIYLQMQKRIHVRETDLDQILEDMRGQSFDRKAFYCEYGVFQKMFLLQVRLKERDRTPVSIVLISLYRGNAEIAGKDMQNEMLQLKDVLLSSLRHADTVTQYSSSQYLLMLSGCTLEQSNLVVRRVRAGFYRICKDRSVQLQHSTREILWSELDETMNLAGVSSL